MAEGGPELQHDARASSLVGCMAARMMLQNECTGRAALQARPAGAFILAML